MPSDKSGACPNKAQQIAMRSPVPPIEGDGNATGFFGSWLFQYSFSTVVTPAIAPPATLLISV